MSQQPVTTIIPEMINLQRGKVYFGLQFRRFQSMVGWPYCFKAITRQYIMEGVCFPGGKNRRPRSHNPPQRYTVKDLKPPTCHYFLNLPPPPSGTKLRTKPFTQRPPEVYSRSKLQHTSSLPSRGPLSNRHIVCDTGPRWGHTAWLHQCGSQVGNSASWCQETSSLWHVWT